MPTNTDELRALNRRVAEVVMGWRIESSPDSQWSWHRLVTSDGFPRGNARISADEAWRIDCPPFSADTPEGWAAMRSVVERMREMGYGWHCLGLRASDDWGASFVNKADTRIGAGAQAKSGPEATALAAIAALEATDAD